LFSDDTNSDRAVFVTGRDLVFVATFEAENV
jgi:hypothetical protein